MKQFLSILKINCHGFFFVHCSDANLIKDDFLRSNMDVQGWVPISLIANFPRVCYLCLIKHIFLSFGTYIITLAL